MKKWIAVLFLAITAAGAQSQAVTAFISNGSGGWAAAVSSSATGAISIPPPAPYLYCQNQATATSFSITTDAVTVEATNSFAAGNRVYLAGWTAATYFNGQTDHLVGGSFRFAIRIRFHTRQRNQHERYWDCDYVGSGDECLF
jgi:hypothetical protein